MTFTTTEARSDSASFTFHRFANGTVIITWRYADTGRSGTLPVPADLADAFIAAFAGRPVEMRARSEAA